MSGTKWNSDAVVVRPVVEAEVHRVEQRGALGQGRNEFVTTCRPVASQPLSTEDRIGPIQRFARGGQPVSFAPARWSYQL